MGIEFTNEFWSAIAGAVVGGGIAFAVQMCALLENRKQKESDRLLVDQGIANSLMFKLCRLHADFERLRAHIEDSLQRKVPGGHHNEPWSSVRPWANLPIGITFSSEEMGLLLKLKEDDLFNSIFSLDAVRSALIDILGQLKTERQKLFEKMPSRVIGTALVQISLSKEEAEPLRIQMDSVNQLVLTAYEWCQRDAKTALDAIEKLQTALRDKLSWSFEFKLISAGHGNT